MNKKHASQNSRRKSNHQNEPARDQGSKDMASLRGQASQRKFQAQTCNETTTSSALSSNQIAEGIDTYTAARISQWAAHSATGPSVQEFGPPEHSNFNFGDELASATMASEVSNQLTGPPLDAFRAFHLDSTGTSYNMGMSVEESNTANLLADFSPLDMDHEGTQGLGFGFPSSLDTGSYATGLSPSVNEQAFPALPSSDVFGFDSVDSHSMMMTANNSNGLGLSSSWSPSGLEVTEPLEWLPTPSSSSVQTSDSLSGHQPDTPISTAHYDGMFTMSHHGSLEAEPEMNSCFNFREAMTTQSLTGLIDPESTIRPRPMFQRTPISMELCAIQETTGLPYALPAVYQGINGSRRSSEGEVKVARDHPYYSLEAKEDGFYHCPYAERENCTHKPEKLKCNYHKHLDSHLKPYRCKWPTCSQIHFSSTACLLRHEREAHGMHGHGPKPYLCRFKDCDRAQENNGFPRSWNLKDHMKRVHDFVATEPSNKSNSPSPSSTSSVDLPRKRRTPSPILEGAAKKVKISAPSRNVDHSIGLQTAIQSGNTSTVPGYRPQSLNQIWYNQVAQVQARLQSLDPTDPRQLKQYQADTDIIQNIGMRMQYHRQI